MINQVVRANGTVFNPRNLGWILKHWMEVESINARRSGEGYIVLFWARSPQTKWWSFETYFMDGSVLKDWLDRPVFRGLTITWNGSKCFIGGQVYKDAEV